MVKSQAFRLVPAIKLERLCQAFTRVSWARSSAASWLPVKERAKARRNGTRPSNSVLKSGFSGFWAWADGAEVGITIPSSPLYLQFPPVRPLPGPDRPGLFAGLFLVRHCGIPLLRHFCPSHFAD